MSRDTGRQSTLYFVYAYLRAMVHTTFDNIFTSSYAVACRIVVGGLRHRLESFVLTRRSPLSWCWVNKSICHARARANHIIVSTRILRLQKQHCARIETNKHGKQALGRSTRTYALLANGFI